jgi:1,4-dihydroxy-2-naphthoate octaprenyltransferase
MKKNRNEAFVYAVFSLTWAIIAIVWHLSRFFYNWMVVLFLLELLLSIKYHKNYLKSKQIARDLNNKLKNVSDDNR